MKKRILRAASMTLALSLLVGIWCSGNRFSVIKVSAAEETAPEETEEESDPVSEAEAEEESESQPITEPEPVFDIEYWIGYARNTAAGLGLEFDSSAVDCWDNPITANPDCIYLESAKIQVH